MSLKYPLLAAVIIAIFFAVYNSEELLGNRNGYDNNGVGYAYDSVYDYDDWK